MRNLGLDILRFIAVLLVVFRHLEPWERDSSLIKIVQTGGWVGVDLFFVISGFLISSLLFKELSQTQSVELKRFLIRRGFKIYPPFWVSTIFSILIFKWVEQGPSLQQIFTEILFLQNYLNGIWLYTWSLAVEEHFYFGVALVFWALKQFNVSKSIKFLPWICFTTLFVGAFLRYIQIPRTGPYFYFMYAFSTHLRIDSLCFGVLLAYFFHFKKWGQNWGPFASAVGVFLGIALLAPAFIFYIEQHQWVLIWGATLFYIGSGFILLGALKIQNSKMKWLRFIGILGGASYSIYLWHMPVRIWLIPWIFRKFGLSGATLNMWLYVIGSFVVGWIMHCLIEKPVLRLRDKIYSSHRRDPQYRLQNQLMVGEATR